MRAVPCVTNTPRMTEGERRASAKLVNAMTRLKTATAKRRAEVPGTQAHDDAWVAEERLDREVFDLARRPDERRVNGR